MRSAPTAVVGRAPERSGPLRWLLGSRSDPVLLRPALLVVLGSTGGLYAWVFVAAVH